MSALFGRTFMDGHYGDKGDDKKMLKVGWRYYFKINGMEFLPGWLVLLLTQVAYFGRRVGDDEIRKAIKASFDKLKNTAMGRKIDNEAPVDPKVKVEHHAD